MNFVRYFQQLENVVGFSTIYVEQFDVNTPNSGGGVFKWVPSSNIGVANITGLRIKPLATTAGYWLRDYSGPLHVNWFGVRNDNQTLTALGITQPVADARYGAGLVTVSTDTYDTAAIKYVFKLMETPGYNAVEFGNGTYWVGSSIELPRFQTGVTVPMFTIRGNGCIVRHTASFIGTTFNRIPPNQSAALNGGYIASRFFISGFSFIGTGASTAIRLGPSFSSQLSDIEFTEVDYGIRLEFCLNARLTNIMGIPNLYGIYLDYGGVWGGNNSDSQCNHTQIRQCRIFNTNTVIASMFIRGASGVSIKDSIVEGFSPQYGIYFNSDSSTVVKDFTIENTHVETTCTAAAFYIRASDGQYSISKVFNQYAQTLIEFDVPSGYPQLNVDKISWTHPSTKFANKNAGGVWKFTECQLGEAPWETSPAAYHPYNSSAWLAGGGYFQPTAKYSALHVLQPNYRCYVIDPVLRQLTDD